MIFYPNIFLKEYSVEQYLERMKDALDIKGLSPRTKIIYLEKVKAFFQYCKSRGIENAASIDLAVVNDYQLFLVKEKKAGWTTFNQSVCSIRFLLGNTLHKNLPIARIPYQKKREPCRTY